MKTNSVNISFSQKLTDFKTLVKFRLNLLVLFSAVVAFLIASGGRFAWIELIVLSLGGFLVTGAANALNQVLEKDIDKLMKRTENRPLASGRMTVSKAVLYAGLMSVAGLIFLAMFNPLTALLGAFSLILYAFVYTPMKKVSSIAVLIGAIPGALPTMIGCVAFSGGITELAIVLFGIQFFWQFPHFWAIAWVGYEDYAKAGYFLLPSKDGERDKNAGFQSLLYTIVLIAISLMPYFMGVTGFISVIVLTIVGIIYAYYSWNLYKQCTKEAALKLMFCSFIYLPVALLVLLIDLL